MACHRSATVPRRTGRRSLSLCSAPATSDRAPSPPEKIAVVGGGLAGLSACYQLLRKRSAESGSVPDVTIIDKAEPGAGGASSKAGGQVRLCRRRASRDARNVGAFATRARPRVFHAGGELEPSEGAPSPSTWGAEDAEGASTRRRHPRLPRMNPANIMWSVCLSPPPLT